MSELMATRTRKTSDGVAVLALALMLVLAGTLAYLATREPNMHTWRLVGDIDAAAFLVVLGGLAFPVATILACRIEGLANPSPIDHLRQCSVLYAAVVVGTLALLAGAENRGSLGYAIGALAVAGALVGVVANAATLAARGRRARAI